ncbi:YL1 nuclear protein-domain-containing protein [Talaromyces proteolyticus]|uniref:YL1 nuclear protein-domain-containing protein n=1 Tax=Talaromyces proteolyticus TaxID=1131652 RepID=A0AAD4KSH8_9EURO|nr:YL1 nuclear protein-domain-containing protein [Talaromyces proteolyticus]KAH8696090.1 YL1 nuclear protein-domain-containing protein [Talaromyces proteolyticus]
MAAVDSDHALTGDETSDDEVVESLIAGREKRSTAGRNMSSLLDAAADDDLTLLFAEDENDNEFDEVEGAEGEAEEMSSSEDEDDQGPNTADDDLEGEKELEKQAKADRKKRKAQESLRLTALRKKVKIDPTIASSVPSAVSRPKKKSERISWLPTPEEGPVRSSSRRQTMQNKEMTHARLKDSEQRRIKLIATMEQAAKRKERMKPKVMTQEERLAEAEKIERMNSKSLNRWEEMEKKKAEERKAKLEALQNRRLEGPVMSWWSGVAKWVNGKLVRVGNVEVKPKSDKEETEKKKKTKDAANQDASKTDKKAEQTTDNPAVEGIALQPPAVNGIENVPKAGADAVLEPNSNGKGSGSNGFLDGIHNYVSLPASPAPEKDQPENKSSEPKTVTSEAQSSPKPEGTGSTSQELQDRAPRNPQPESKSADTAAEGRNQTPQEETEPTSNTLPTAENKIVEEAQEVTSSETKPVGSAGSAEPAMETTTSTDSVQQPAIAPSLNVATIEASEMEIDQPLLSTDPTPEHESNLPPQPEVIEHTGRNLLVLENFDNATTQSRQYSIYFNSKKPPRLAKISSHLCPITSQPSRYRDCETGLPFASALAYREIRNLTEQKYIWSAMLGCYIGPPTVAAKGVPEQFLTGVKPEKKDQDNNEQTTRAGKENENSGVAVVADGEPMDVDKS